jgi:hypothetical protein
LVLIVFEYPVDFLGGCDQFIDFLVDDVLKLLDTGLSLWVVIAEGSLMGGELNDRLPDEEVDDRVVEFALDRGGDAGGEVVIESGREILVDAVDALYFLTWLKGGTSRISSKVSLNMEP